MNRVKIKTWFKRKYRELTVGKYFNKQHKPIKCTSCGSVHVEAKTVDSMEHIELERTYSCSDCGEYLGSWAHGYYDSEDVMDYLMIEQD